MNVCLCSFQVGNMGGLVCFSQSRADNGVLFKVPWED